MGASLACYDKYVAEAPRVGAMQKIEKHGMSPVLGHAVEVNSRIESNSPGSNLVVNWLVYRSGSVIMDLGSGFHRFVVTSASSCGRLFVGAALFLIAKTIGIRKRLSFQRRHRTRDAAPQDAVFGGQRFGFARSQSFKRSTVMSGTRM